MILGGGPPLTDNYVVTCNWGTLTILQLGGLSCLYPCIVYPVDVHILQRVCRGFDERGEKRRLLAGTDVEMHGTKRS